MCLQSLELMSLAVEGLVCHVCHPKTAVLGLCTSLIQNREHNASTAVLCQSKASISPLLVMHNLLACLIIKFALFMDISVSCQIQGAQTNKKIKM